MMELQDIFSQYGESYRQNHKLPGHIIKTMNAITRCRTQALGAHADICDDCGHVRISYNSCRNRHCPKCQTLTKERWIERQKGTLLNVGYFHVVFTVPDTLNALAFHNQEIIYNILFKAAAQSLHELALDRKYLGASIGFTSILHTWGQNLMHHPHIHCVVPGGGVTPFGKWVSCRGRFFLPIKVLSRKFRGKFLYFLRQAKLVFFAEQEYLSDPFAFSLFLTDLYKKEWIVYCKPPFKTADCVVEYLGRYTHRVAISNSRFVKMEDERVSFRWRDYKDGSKVKIMTLSAHEFIRRFLIHVLPPGFMKIRHYGILGNRNRNTRLLTCKRLTNTPIVARPVLSSAELIRKLFGVDILRCACCGSGNLRPFPVWVNTS
jgi:hypothetical protein